jgi:hypothetical protein
MTESNDSMHNLLPLREPTFFILLSLSAGEKHGYAILKEVEAHSAGRVQLSTSTLYEALARLQDQNLIERVESGPGDPQDTHPGRPPRHIASRSSDCVLRQKRTGCARWLTPLGGCSVRSGMNPPALQRLYPLLLSLYPAAFRAEYGEEIRLVYEQALDSKQGLPAWRLVLRELTSLPLVLIRLHWRDWSRKGFRSIFILPDLPTRDGRHSWGLAGLESLFFVVWTCLLVRMTYTNVEWLKAGWFRDIALVGILAALLPLPILLLGLGRGLPRWAYPYFGLLLTYLCYAGWRFHLELVAAVLLLALFVIGAAAAWGNGRRPLHSRSSA